MSTINNKFFSPSQLKSIRDAVNGTGGGEFRIKSAFSTSLKEMPKVDDGLQDVLIIGPTDSIFKSDVDLSESLKAQGVRVAQDFDEMGATARLSPEKVAQLKESGYQVFDNSPRPMWGLPGASNIVLTGGDYSMPEVKPVPWLKADQVHQSGRTGKGQTVAVLDSGFDHPAYELAGWKDVVNNSETPVDRVGHGTHVVHDVLQAAPDAGIVAVKVMRDDGSGRPSDIIAGIRYVLEQNARGADIDIINMSLGGGPDGYPEDGYKLQPIDGAAEFFQDLGMMGQFRKIQELEKPEATAADLWNEEELMLSFS